MKKIVILSIACLIATFAIVSIGKTSYKTYYSGDAVNYNNKLVIASTDSGSLEVFIKSGENINQVIKIKANNSILDKTNDFSSVKLNIENGRLFAYATSAYTLYKYDISNFSHPVVFAKQKNTYYEWYHRVDKFGANIVTVSEKGVKVWISNSDVLDVINSYSINIDSPYNVRFDSAGQYIFTINKNNIVRIFDVVTKDTIAQFPVNYREANNLYKSYYETNAQELYVFDDYYLKVFNLKGELVRSFPNSSSNGYSVEPSSHLAYVYVTNGQSIMKLAKSDLKSGLKVPASNFNRNAWAMSTKYVNTISGDNLVVFNGGGITVLNSSLQKLASVDSTEIVDVPKIKEDLVLALNNNSGTIGANVNLRGAGYLPYEKLKINFGGHYNEIDADRNGRFDTNLTVPQLNTGVKVTDIKVDGLESNLSYSISFNVKASN